jgi:hypothetical protein
VVLVVVIVSWGNCIVKARGVLQKGKLRPESERERKARSETEGKKTRMSSEAARQYGLGRHDFVQIIRFKVLAERSRAKEARTGTRHMHRHYRWGESVDRCIIACLQTSIY